MIAMGTLMSVCLFFRSSFRWEKDGEAFGSNRTDSGTLHAEEDEPLESYQGLYRCFASNTLGTAMTHAVQVIVERESNTLVHT